MWTGFYKLNNIKDLDTLKSFYRDALEMSMGSCVHIIPEGEYQRVNHPDLSPIDYIENHISLDTHNVAVNRFVQSGCQEWSEKICEIGSTVLIGTPLYLFIQVDFKSMEKLVKKYNLKKK